MGALTAPILVVNVGSTSVKLALFRAGERDAAWSRDVPLAGGVDRIDVITESIRACPEPLTGLAAVGHRIVHGGSRFTAATVVDAVVEDAIAVAAEFAPLHNRAGLDGVHAARRVVDANVMHVAVFDTAFHHTVPLAAAVYGGPYQWVAAGLRRYGFHGISHQYAARTAAELLGRPLEQLRLVTCHLGGGCSITAVDGGRSVDTTMGLTPLDGLIMSTRSGSVDPALILHLLRRGATIDEVDDLLEHRSGLAGLSGVSGDLPDVLRARDGGNPQAALAIDAFIHRIASGVGAMIAALGDLDGVVFTGGIGEHSPEVRARVSARLAGFGVEIDETRNLANSTDGVISRDDAVAVLVVAAREARAIADECLALVGSASV